ncbi:Crp/Fnr family transcriptional regulator [Testudinibacter aquarius]|uniref:CRP-like cAMP-binding protein n=1 Tax=Testudinibacter aquarius TaxID=1524974 RepID=A0A4V2W2X6_9PAST|nr:Crp/Fnr family transcriptional regulator [Testudinibacter aquarius]TNG93605.1 Crp/Fnr family transcriptional regulator [Pasteurellaceae bacterium UScroc12]TNG94677.1 Crp/Fnr family transcriptional regulator [Pasteurellaceae bacterium USgator41]TNG95277.1 Crp/Fnr family transcriptional regulator [Pasteurellaceae bacterium UScroc31]TNH00818.1 Crp/Fnr family transcriptional regulator [Pasteurellaceae bacterium USgator11]KAE9529311.1 cyclic nucleotide-binding protein [Testudinibacter aquarius]
MDNSSIAPTALCYCQLIDLHQLHKGMMVYQQGEIAQEFYYVKQGLIGLYHMLDNGKESLVRLYRQGDYFGFRTLFGLDDNHYHCKAKVLIEAEVTRIKPVSIEQFCLHNPQIVKFLLQTLANELRDAEQRLAKSAYLRTLDRVIDSLCFLTSNFPYYNWTYREIAEYAGCETETAIRIAKELKQNGLFSELLPQHKGK